MLFYILSLSFIINGFAFDDVYIWSANEPSDNMVGKISEYPIFIEGVESVMNGYKKVNLYILDHSNCDNLKGLNCLQTKPAARALVDEFKDSTSKLFHYGDSDQLLSFIAKRDHNYSLTQYGIKESTAFYSIKTNIIILSDTNPYKKIRALKEDKSSFPVLNILLSVRKPLYSFLNVRADSPVMVPMKAKGLVDDGRFINFQDCLYFYFYSAYVIYNGNNINLQPSMASSNGSSCSSSSSNLVLSFSSVSPYKTVSTKFTFDLKEGSWQCSALNMEFEETSGKKISVVYSCPTLTAHVGMSYMCNNLTFMPNSKTAVSTDYSVVGFVYIQAQPFVTPNSNQMFGPADSCIYFLNIPIAMGVLIIITVILGTLFGVLSLLNVKGITRIEKPNEFIELGQTIK